jgi:hypothetical protein
LRAEPFADAGAVAQAAAGDGVRVVERKGTWSMVEANGKRGWVRALNLKPEGTTGVRREGVLALETGRQAQGGVSVPLAVRGAPLPGAAAKLLAEIYEGRETSRTLRLSAKREADGSLTMELQPGSNRGYAYVFLAGVGGGDLQCLFPNAAQPDNEIAPGKTLALPAGGWQVSPDGAARLLAVVSDAPFDLMLPDKQVDGPLFHVTVSDSNRAALALALSGGRSYAAASASVSGKR